MSRQSPLATKIPEELKLTLDEVCKKFGLRKNYVVETALREKIEDILDAHDLEESIKEASGFHSWETVKQEI